MKKPKMPQTAAPAAAVAEDPTTSVATLVKKARAMENRRPAATAATGAYGSGGARTLLGSGIK